MASDSALLDSSLKDFEKTQQDLLNKFNSALTRLDINFKSLDDCVTAHHSQLAEYKRLMGMLKQVEEEAKSCKTWDAQKDFFLTVRARLAKTKEFLDRLNETKPRTGSLFLRLMMGQVNVKVWKRGEQLNFKDEYNKFKFRTTWLFMLFPFVQLFIYEAEWLWKLHQCWLVYYYVSLALRENILQVNGSNIQDWWIIHHYIAGIIAAMSLLWPQDYQEWGHLLLWFTFLQGCVMGFQNRYQRTRQYVRKALGKAKDVDVDSSETIVEKPTDLKLLVPMLFAIYLFEIIYGFIFCWKLTRPETFIMGSLFTVLGIGNTLTTSRVLLRQISQRRHQRHQRQMRKSLNPLTVPPDVPLSTPAPVPTQPGRNIACGLTTTPTAAHTPAAVVRHRSGSVSTESGPTSAGTAAAAPPTTATPPTQSNT